MSCDLDTLFRFIQKELTAQYKSYGVKDFRIGKDFFQILCNEPSWDTTAYKEDLKSKKAVEMRNDSLIAATGKLETKPGNMPSCMLQITKGFIGSRQMLSGDFDLKASLNLPPNLKKFKTAPLQVDLTEQVNAANNPNPVELSIDVDLPSGNAAFGEVEVDEIFYKGTFAVAAELRFKMQINTNRGPIDVTQTDASTITKAFPEPFKNVNGKIFWIVNGRLDLRFDHKKIIKFETANQPA